MSEIGIWVIDTSSIIEVRRNGSPIAKRDQTKIYSALGSMVDGGQLAFPPQVHAELKRESGEIDGKDLPLEFADQYLDSATALAPSRDILPRVLAIPGVADVVDSDNIARGGVEPADPYVVAMAWHLQQLGRRVTVITEDRKQDRKDNLISLATACGLAGIPDVPLLPFLVSRRIWTRR